MRSTARGLTADLGIVDTRRANGESRASIRRSKMKLWWAAGAVMAGLAVAAGAFGAHALKGAVVAGVASGI